MKCPACHGTGEVMGQPALPGVATLVEVHAAEKLREDLLSITVELNRLGCPEQMFAADYWRAIAAWLGDAGTKIVVLDELRKYWAWHAAQPRRHRDHKRGFRNWLARAQRFEDDKNAREAQQKDRGGDDRPFRRRC